MRCWRYGPFLCHRADRCTETRRAPPQCLQRRKRLPTTAAIGTAGSRGTPMNWPQQRAAGGVKARQSGGQCQGAEYSTHRCVGVDVNHRESVSASYQAARRLWADHGSHERALQDGTCLFRDVCSINGTLTYMQHPRLGHAAANQVPRVHALSRTWHADPREPCPVWEEVRFDVVPQRIPAHFACTAVPHIYIRRV